MEIQKANIVVDKKQLILDASEMLFAIKGFKETSTRDIAAKAEVNLGLIAYYFGTKNKLLQEIIQRKIGFYQDSFTIIEKLNLPIIEKLNLMVDIYIDHMFKNRHFHLIINSEVHSGKSAENKNYFNNLIYENAQIFNRIIEKGIEIKEVKSNLDYKYIMPTIIGIISIHIRSEQLIAKCLDLSNTAKDSDLVYIENLRTYIKDLLKSYLIK